MLRTRRHAPGGLIYHVLNRGVNRGCPFGDDDSQKAMVQELGLEWTLRPRGRPKKTAAEQAI